MKRRDDGSEERAALRDKIIGLGEASFRKSYFPQLQTQLHRLEQFRSLLNYSRDGIFLVDCATAEIIDANHAAVEIFSSESPTTLTRPFHEYFPEPLKMQVRDILANPASGPEATQMLELDRQGNDGSETVYEFTINNIVTQGQRFLVVVARDITQQKSQEVRLRDSLQEKEALLKEIHHRVKNNLQVISSLLHMQAMENRNPAAEDILRESQLRVKSMALVHERLYQSNDLSGIDFVDYFPSMTRELLRAYGRLDVKLTLDVEPIFLGIDLAIPVGLIASELVSNCLKHAFPDRQSGEIKVSFLHDGNSRARLVVSDDGVGFPPNTDITTMHSMGITLVIGLVKQIDGTIALEQKDHPKLTVVFPVPPPRR
jgi:two-component system, sensor histidine kinase PdtaS